MSARVPEPEARSARHVGHGPTWWLGRWPVLLHRWRLGRLLGEQYVIVVHRGRRTGQVYETGVMVLRKDAATAEVTVVAGSRHADWFRNIETESPVAVFLGGTRYDPHPRFLDTDEIAASLSWSRSHRRRNARVQAWFFHWPWPANAEQLHDFAAALGGVAFRPVSVAPADARSET